jgi:azurin
MDKDQIFKAICDAGVGISDIKDMVHDIELTFTADPICIDREAKEMTIDEVHKSFKDALEEIAEQNKVIDLAVDEVSRMTGGMTTLIAKDKDLDFDEKVATHKKNIKQGLFARCKGDD